MNNRIKPPHQSAIPATIITLLFGLLLSLLIHYPADAQSVQWELQDSLIIKEQYPASFSSIDCADSMNCIATGAFGNVYSLLRATSDGGKSWKTTILDSSEIIPVLRFALRLRTIKFLTPTLALIITDSGAVFRSSDAGATWSRVETGTKSDLIKISVFDAAHAAIIGSPRTILVTADSGKTWKIVPPPSDTTFSKWVIRDVAMTSPNSMVLIMGLYDEGSVFVQDEITKSWPAPQEFAIASNMFFLDGQYGWAAGQKLVGPERRVHNVVERTQDGGKTWRSVLDDSICPTFRLNKIKFIYHQNGAASGFFGKVLLTADGGETWQANNILGTNFIDFAYPTQHQLRIATVFGQIFLGTISQQSSVDEDAALSEMVRILPNPASNTTTIQFSDVAEQIEKITILDALGREHLSFANEQHNNQVLVDTQNLPVGQYFVLLHTKKTIIKKTMMIIR